MELLLQKSLFLIQTFAHLSCDGIPVSVADPEWIRVKAFQNGPQKVKKEKNEELQYVFSLYAEGFSWNSEYSFRIFSFSTVDFYIFYSSFP